MCVFISFSFSLSARVLSLSPLSRLFFYSPPPHPRAPPGYTKRTYKVKRGDTLGQIAEDFGTRASKIRRWNNMKYGSQLIHPGQRLVIWVKEG